MTRNNTYNTIEFNERISLHDSLMISCELGCAGDDFVILQFKFDITWNEGILNWNSNNWPYLFLGICGVNKIELPRVAKNDSYDATVGIMEAIVAEDGSYLTSITSILDHSLNIEHTGDFWLLCYSEEGNLIDFK